MENTNKKLFQMEVLDDGILSYGQRVYVVVSGDRQEFREKCPICDGTTKVTIRGVEFTCPNCRGFYKTPATSIDLYSYEPREYIINAIEIRGEDVKSHYKGDGAIADGWYPKVSYSGFAGSDRKEFFPFCFKPHDPDKVSLKRPVGETCFLKKGEAKAFAKRLHERQKELLDKFNAKHGTQHEYPFEY